MRSSVLLVVGREETGALEAQVRGSRHAWDVRLIGIDALLKLVRLKENTASGDVGAKLRTTLMPVEYTRLDAVVDLVFSAARDVEAVVDRETRVIEEDEEDEDVLSSVRGSAVTVRGDGTTAVSELKAAVKIIAKAATKGVIHKNTASRYISRLSKQVAGASAPATA